MTEADTSLTDPVALTRALVMCPSVTPDAGGALDRVEDWLGRLGFQCHRLPFGGDAPDRADNLFASLGTGSPHICFAGHVDVVPVGNPDAWTVDPFGGEIRDGTIYGRGATDMKGGVAAFIAGVARYLSDGTKPPGTISLLITGDEEGPAINGTRRVLEWMEASGLVPDHCIVGEPTNPAALGDMIKIGRRGSATGTLTVSGRSGHTAYPDRADNPLPRLVAMLDRLANLTLDRGSEHFQPSNLQLTSIDVGNSASNVIPANGRATFNIRFNDHHSGASLEALVRHSLDTVTPDYKLDWWISGESFITEPGPWTALVAEAVTAVTGRRPEFSTSGGTSDARFIQAWCPVLEFGAVGATMHQADENARTADLENLARIYQAILNRYFERPPS